MKMKLVAPVFGIAALLCGLATANILKDYKSFEVIPDILDKAPNSLLKVSYNGQDLQFGKEFTCRQVKDAPIIEWNFDPSSFYTLIMTGDNDEQTNNAGFLIDPDAPSRKDPKFREYLHWLVVNIPGDRFSDGENLAEYIGAGPPQDTGLHRYVFSVYKQPGKLNFAEKPISNMSLEGRPSFTLRTFAAKYNLDGPIAGNMFQAQFDDYVPEFYRKFGIVM